MFCHEPPELLEDDYIVCGTPSAHDGPDERKLLPLTTAGMYHTVYAPNLAAMIAEYGWSALQLQT